MKYEFEGKGKINTQANIAVSSSHIASKYPLQHVQVLRHLNHIKPVTIYRTLPFMYY